MGDAEHAAVRRPARGLVESAAVLVGLHAVDGLEARPVAGGPDLDAVVLAHGHNVLQ